MMKKNFSLVFLLLIFCLWSNNVHSYVYQIDDDSGETSLGYSYEWTWANQFDVQGDYNQITGIYIAFGYKENDQDLIGANIVVKLWNDPDNDQNPDDAILLTSLTSTITATGYNNFLYFDITDTIVSGNFFAGVTYSPSNPGPFTFPAQADKNNGQGRSWYSLSSDISNSPKKIKDISKDYNFMIRAEASKAPTVPEPSTLLLILPGLFLIKRKLK